MAETDPLRYKPDSKGGFARTNSAFRHVISRDPNSKFPAEAGRYTLYLSPGCPWSHRTIIVRAMKRLEDLIGLHLCDMGKEVWHVEDDGTSPMLKASPPDPSLGIKTVRELYLRVDPDYQGRVTVPVLWDTKTNTIVSNESSDIIRMFYSEFDHLLPESDREVNRPGGGSYPEHLRKDIDEINEWVYDTVNNGVYKCGFAFSQSSYDSNVDKLFESLDRLEKILGDRPFLMGDHITDADIRLFPTIVRFDIAYVPVFMCNLGMIRHDYPNLHLWLRRLYWDQSDRTHGGFFKTTKEWIPKFKPGYAEARTRVLGIEGPLIVPRGPRVLVHELREDEKL